MIYKIEISTSIPDEELYSTSYSTDIQEHSLTGNPIIEFNNSSIIILYNNEGFICGFEIANECTRTWNAEENLLNFISKILEKIETNLEIFDSTGYSEIVSKEDFLENYSDYLNN